MQREYGLDLRVAMPTMSWRRFMVLVRGLSPNSATVTRLRAGLYMGGRPSNERVVAITTPKAAERAFSVIFGPPPKQTRPD